MLFRRKPRNRRLQRTEVLDVKVRASVRRQTWLRRLAFVLSGLFAVIFSVFLFWHGLDWVLKETVYKNPAFEIQQFEVETDGVIALQQLRTWSGVKLRDNLLALDLARVKRDLEMVPAIESVQVERVLPHTLRLRVHERIPLAKLVFPSRRAGTTNDPPTIFHLDAGGYFMFPIDPAQRASPAATNALDYPVLTGVALSEVRPGRASESPQVHAALEMLQAFERSPMAALVEIVEVGVGGSGSLTVTTAQSCCVVLGLRNFDQQFRRWKAIYDHGQKIGRHVAWMDLSVSNNVPARWIDVSVVPIPPTKPAKTTASKKRHV